MIRTIKIELNAAFPQMPLIPFQVFHDSAAAITILNVPRRILALSLKIKNVSAVEQTFAAVRSGSAWSVTVPGTFFGQSGTSTRGVKIIGVDELANAFTLGAADLVVMLDNGTVTPVQPSGDGDMKHSEFADLEVTDNMTLNESNALMKKIVTKLKGAIPLLLLSVCCSSLFAAPITPDTEFGDISPTNKLKEVVEASGAVSGCDTNAVDALANAAVVTNALTVATTNRVDSLETATNNLSSSVSGLASSVSSLSSSVSGLASSKADRPALPVTNGNLAALTADGSLADSGKNASDFAPAVDGGYLPIVNTWLNFDAWGNTTLFGRLIFSNSSKEIFATSEGLVYSEFAPVGPEKEIAVKGDITSAISATNPTFSNEVATVARTVTPPPSPTLRLYDEVRQCYWIGRMVNGVINWEVE